MEKNLSEQILDVNNVKILRVTSIKEFIKWVEREIILKSPKARQNLIKLKKRVGDNLI